MQVENLESDYESESGYESDETDYENIPEDEKNTLKEFMDEFKDRTINDNSREREEFIKCTSLNRNRMKHYDWMTNYVYSDLPDILIDSDYKDFCNKLDKNKYNMIYTLNIALVFAKLIYRITTFWNDEEYYKYMKKIGYYILTFKNYELDIEWIFDEEIPQMLSDNDIPEEDIDTKVKNLRKDIDDIVGFIEYSKYHSIVFDMLNLNQDINSVISEFLNPFDDVNFDKNYKNYITKKI